MTTATLGNSGIVLSGGPDEYGVRWSWTRGSDPWQPGPTPREVSGPRGSAHGSWNATRYAETRRQELSVLVKAPSHEAMHHAQQRWMDAISIRPFEFVVDEPFFGRRYAMMRRVSVGWSEDAPLVARAIASLTADDPLIYSTESQTSRTGFPASTGGLQWPTEWPATWDAVVESGLLLTDSNGSEQSPALWRIDGPVVDPMVTRVADGARFRLSMDIPEGDWVTVDTATHTVLYRGDAQASRRVQWSGSWLDVPPGRGEFTFSGAAGGPPAELSVTWQNAWL